jgi:hypothetical protein
MVNVDGWLITALPEVSRIVLSWGASPKDLDSYLTVPHSDPAKDECVINYKKKVQPAVL